MNYFLNAFLHNYANFTGRARREEYWMFILFNTIVVIVLMVLSVLDGSIIILLGIYLVGAFVPWLSILVRRLHDSGKSGWFFFVRFIPLAGPIWLLVLLCTDSDCGQNPYGYNPKGIGNSDYNESAK